MFTGLNAVDQCYWDSTTELGSWVTKVASRSTQIILKNKNSFKLYLTQPFCFHTQPHLLQDTLSFYWPFLHLSWNQVSQYRHMWIFLPLRKKASRRLWHMCVIQLLLIICTSQCVQTIVWDNFHKSLSIKEYWNIETISQVLSCYMDRIL